MPVCSGNPGGGGAATPTLDCAIQPAPVVEGKRKMGFLLALIAIVLIMRSAFVIHRIKRKARNEEKISAERGSPARPLSDQRRLL